MARLTADRRRMRETMKARVKSMTAIKMMTADTIYVHKLILSDDFDKIRSDIPVNYNYY